jgi:Family of unknown function (DUF6962)
VPLAKSSTELTTAGTDLAMGLFAVAVSLLLLQVQTNAVWKQHLWVWVFALMAAASFLGTAAHGLDLSEPVRSALWQPLYLSLCLSVTLFVVGGICDWRGETAARQVLPWALGIGTGVFALIQVLGGAFAVFVAYEVAAMLAALAIYGSLGVTGGLEGAGLVAAGILLTIAAGAVQASDLRVRLVVPFDHNGLFHLVQLVATATLAGGLRIGLAGRL